MLTLLGSAIWCFAFAGAGWAAGASWERFHDAFRYVDYLVAAVVVAVALLLAASPPSATDERVGMPAQAENPLLRSDCSGWRRSIGGTLGRS